MTKNEKRLYKRTSKIIKYLDGDFKSTLEVAKHFGFEKKYLNNLFLNLLTPKYLESKKVKIGQTYHNFYRAINTEYSLDDFYNRTSIHAASVARNKLLRTESIKIETVKRKEQKTIVYPTKYAQLTGDYITVQEPENMPTLIHSLERADRDKYAQQIRHIHNTR